MWDKNNKVRFGSDLMENKMFLLFLLNRKLRKEQRQPSIQEETPSRRAPHRPPQPAMMRRRGRRVAELKLQRLKENLQLPVSSRRFRRRSV